MSKVTDILENYDQFPCKISEEEGMTLKNDFKLLKNSLKKQNVKGDVEFKYYKDIDGKNYILIEEYLFRDGETFLDIKKSIGINYYLNHN